MTALATISGYKGAEISPLFYQRWRDRGRQVGPAKPDCKVYVRKGFFKRDWVRWPGPAFGEFAGSNKQGLVWAPRWIPYTNYVEVPGIAEVNLEQSFENNGVTAMTLRMDNINWAEVAGAGGAYHKKTPGYFAPLFGVLPGNRPRQDMVANEFYMLFPNAQITVYEGYGDQLVKTFTGLVDDISPASSPTQMVLNCRDFGGILTDQKMYGWVKDPYLPSPVVFAPRGIAEQRKRVGGGAKASSEQSGYPAKNVIPAAGEWRSQPRQRAGDVDWVEIRIPAGKYSSCFVNPAFGGQEVFIGLFARPLGTPSNPRPPRIMFDDSLGIDDLTAGHFLRVAGHWKSVAYGWVDLGRGDVGPTAGPHNDGPWPFIRQAQFSTKSKPLSFGFEVECGKDSVLRLGFKTGVKRTINGHRRYQSGAKRFLANQNTLTAEAKSKRWIVISDASEIVMSCLRWAGFKEWEVESAGVELKEKYTVAKDKSLMDVIQDVRNNLGYTFFMAEPTSDDLSLGVPIFRKNRVLDPAAQVDEIRDSDLLEDTKVKWSNKNERGHIIVRGKLLKKALGGQKTDGDVNYRAAFHYTPPWAYRNAAVLKHLVYYDPTFQTKADCATACYLIALQIGLSIATAIVTTPGTPHIGLDTLIGLVDHSTGLNSRLYVSNRRRSITRGEEVKYTLELGGSLVDTPDMDLLSQDVANGLLANDRNDQAEDS